jgi:hypothetical protein
MMAAATASTSLVPVQPVFTGAERLALAGFLAGYRGVAREACTLRLRQFTGWCRTRSLPLFSVRRAGIETFAREMEALGRARATVTRRLCAIAGLYKYAVEVELLGHSHAAHVRRPRLDYESHATALDRNELGALLVAARAREHRAQSRSRLGSPTGRSTGLAPLRAAVVAVNDADVIELSSQPRLLQLVMPRMHTIFFLAWVRCRNRRRITAWHAREPDLVPASGPVIRRRPRRRITGDSSRASQGGVCR